MRERDESAADFNTNTVKTLCKNINSVKAAADFNTGTVKNSR